MSNPTAKLYVRYVAYDPSGPLRNGDLIEVEDFDFLAHAAQAPAWADWFEYYSNAKYQDYCTPCDNSPVYYLNATHVGDLVNGVGTIRLRTSGASLPFYSGKNERNRIIHTG
jgi:hypothetical protein